MDALLRRRAMIAAVGGGEPPTPPVSISYIRGGADGQYIDTGITPDNTTKIIVWARNFNPSAEDYTWLFGSRVSYQDAMFSLLADKAVMAGSIGIDYGSNALQDVTNAWTLLSHYHKYELGPDGLFVDDVLVASIQASTFSSNISIHLFGENVNGEHRNANSNIDICSCKIYKSGNLVRDYTPVDSPSVGLYDAVSDTVFTNAGEGSLSYGVFDANAYTPLEYIECSGNQYFLTPESGTYSLPIVVKFRSVLTSAVWGHVLSGQNQTNRCDIFTGNLTQRNSRLYALLGTGSATAMKNGASVGYFDNKDVVIVKNKNVFTGYVNNTSIGSHTGSTNTSFDTEKPLALGAENANGTVTLPLTGRIYYARVGENNYCPAKKNNAVGMYDTYNDVFKQSESGTAFIAGPALNS